MPQRLETPELDGWFGPKELLFFDVGEMFLFIETWSWGVGLVREQRGIVLSNTEMCLRDVEIV